MRVLMVVPQYPYPVVGGLEKQAHELASELVRQGARVRVLSGRVSRGQARREQINGVDVYRLPWPRSRALRWLASPWLFVVALTRLALQSDVVHCHVICPSGLAVVAMARLLRRPVLLKLANVGDGGLPGVRKSTLGAVKLLVVRHADAVVAMCSDSLHELAEIRYPAARILISSNGIKVPARRQGPLQARAGVCRLLFVGRLHPQKGLGDLSEAFQAAVSRLPEGGLTLDIIGDGEERAALVSAIESRGIGASVRMHGHLEVTADVMARGDALVLPSYWEGNSNVILEAMACGLPVISTAVGGTPMLVGTAGAELLHAPGDTGALTRLIETIAADPGMRSRTGEAMRARVEQYFDIRVVARRYLLAYGFLANGQRTRMGELACGLILAPVGRGADG